MTDGSAIPLEESEVHVWSFPLGEPARGLRRQLARGRRTEILASYLGVAPDEVQIVRADAGKPALAGGELEFNLSHSGTLAVLAVARSLPVGIDLEMRRETVDLERGIRDRCSAREGDWVRAAADPYDAWVRLWSRKEAVVKATGEGVLDQLASIDVLDEIVVRTDVASDERWRCLDLDPPAAGYHLALALPALEGVRVVSVRG